MYEIKIIFDKEDAEMLIMKHGFRKVKRKWVYKSDRSLIRFSTQEALQCISLCIISDEIRGRKKIKVNPKIKSLRVDKTIK